MRAAVQSIMMHGSSPTVHASWPGATNAKSPGPTSNCSPLAGTIAMRPLTTYTLWVAWQLSVPANGEQFEVGPERRR